jgi:hypothetical protein
MSAALWNKLDLAGLAMTGPIFRRIGHHANFGLIRYRPSLGYLKSDLSLSVYPSPTHLNLIANHFPQSFR